MYDENQSNFGYEGGSPNLVNYTLNSDQDLSFDSGATGSYVDLVDNPTDTTSGEGFTTPIEIFNPASKPGEPGYGWKYYTDGTSISPEGKYYYQGDQVYDPANPSGGFFGALSKILGPNLSNSLKGMFVNKDGSVNLAGIGAVGAGLYSLLGDKSSGGGGYTKSVPAKTAYREVIDQPARPVGAQAMGRQYFTDVQYLPQGDAGALEAAKSAAAAQKAAARMPEYKQPVAQQSIIPVNWNKPVATATTQAPTGGLPTIPNAAEIARQTYFNRNESGMASGGIAAMRNPRYLRGTTDGMADKIPSSIDNKQPAALSHGEFVIPADVVAHLGNGNSDAGAKKLYEMMARVRKARTGTEKQGKKINPEKFMPGGLAAMAAGGDVYGYQTGGVVSPGVTTGGASAGVNLDTSKTSTLSPWVGDYVTTALGEAQGLAAMPFQAYQGPLAAGASDLQGKAFAGIEDIAKSGFQPTTYGTQSFTAEQAGKYMNPYLSAALQPQLSELRREAEIAQQALGGKFGRAGALGGGRQAISESENIRNLLGKQADVLGRGYASAYDKAMEQFNKEQGRQFEAEKASEESRKTASDYGYKSLAEMARLGQIQRDIEADQIAAEKAAFEEQRAYPYKMPQYKLSLLGGLPTGTTTSTTDTSGLPGLLQNLSGMAALYEVLGKLGIKGP